MINLEAVKLKSLANRPTVFRNLSIEPKSLNAIIDIGYKEYNHNLYLISLTVEDIIKALEEKNIEIEVSLIEFFLHGGDSDSLIAYLSAISYFINEDVSLSPSMDGITIKDESFSFEEVDVITNIIKIQNCVVSKDDDSFNPLNENAKKLREKMLARQRKLRKLKEDDNGENSLSFLDLISVLCSNANGINLLNVFDLNFFQFNDQFNRMKLLDEYEVNIQALLHGADSKNIKLKHWISKGE